MGVRNAKREELGRLKCKTHALSFEGLDAQFRTVPSKLRAWIQEGLNCSPFEAEAVVDVVQEVYGPYLNGSDGAGPPGVIRLVVVDADEPAGRPVADCRKRTIRLTLHRGAQDDRCLQEQGAEAFRRSRIPDLCQEALSQRALLSNCDLAELLGADDRRVAQALTTYERRTKKLVPRRATLHDVGTGLTHKRIICWKRYAQGKSAELVAKETDHSLEAVDRYLGQFDRVRHCRQQGLSVDQTAYTLNCSRTLVEEYPGDRLQDGGPTRWVTPSGGR